MLKFALIIGVAIGAVVATLMQQPKDEPLVVEDESSLGLVDKVKHQVREAQVAAQAEAKAKEAEIMAEYEANRHGPKQSS